MLEISGVGGGQEFWERDKEDGSLLFSGFSRLTAPKLWWQIKTRPVMNSKDTFIKHNHLYLELLNSIELYWKDLTLTVASLR